MMDNAQQWSTLVGAILPMVMALLIQTTWKSEVKAVVAFLACVVAGLGTTYFAGRLVFTSDYAQSITTDVLLVLTAAFATYHGFWKPSGVAPGLERLTNLPHVKVQIQRGTPPTQAGG